MKHVLRITLATALGVRAFTVAARDRWTPEQANTWYAKQPWLVGCDFGPSTRK